MISEVQSVVKMEKSRRNSACPPAFDMATLAESLAMAEIKAAASSTHRKMSCSRKTSTEQQHLAYVPPKQLLMYLVR